MQNETPAEKLNFKKINHLARDLIATIEEVFPFLLNEKSAKTVSDAIYTALNDCILGVADNCITITDHWGEQDGNNYCATMIAADIESRVSALRPTIPTVAASAAAAD